MKNWMKKITAFALVGMMVLGMTACGLATCENCGESGAKRFKSVDEARYFCESCDSSCVFCGDEASHCYDSMLGTIFTCQNCYDEIMELNGR